jgi:multiple sugar transport system permease protein
MKRNSILGNLSGYVVLIVIAIITVFPIVYTVSSSFKTNSEILAYPERIFPEKATLENYIIAFNSDDFKMGRMTLNSIYFTVASLIITMFASSMSGYVFARGEFPYKKAIFTSFTALMFINMGGITVYPLFEILNFINVPISLHGLIFLRLFAIPIINIYLVKSYINTLPKAIDEAAIIDGCSFISIFFKVIAPLLKPILATIGILAFQASWNEYLMPTIFTMSVPHQRTLIVGVVALKNSSDAASAWNLMLAGTTVAITPVLVAYAIGNRYFVKGLASGAIKG